MKKVSIKNKMGIIGWEATMEDPTEWIANLLAVNYWGLPERWVLHKDELMAQVYDEADVLEEHIVEDIPAIPAELDENGNVIKEEIPAKTHKEVKLRAEYSIEIVDITDEFTQNKTNIEALEYLALTDWLIIREMDAGIPCPSEIKAERAAARAKIVR